jgi:pyridoxamine-phosphate oxidase
MTNIEIRLILPRIRLLYQVLYSALHQVRTARYSTRITMDALPNKIQINEHKQYDSPDSLSPFTVSPSPLDQFRIWFSEALDSGVVDEPEVISLSTATPSGIPSARMVLFKQLDTRGFVFFTNYTSRKSQELLANPHAALVFYWKELHRSVRVLGNVEKVTREASEKYFQSRPVGSRLGAWASNQSAVVEEGEVHARLEQIRERFGVDDAVKEADIPLPDFWGGWRVVPKCDFCLIIAIKAGSDDYSFFAFSEVEFWSGKPSRLHDRVRYLRVETPSSDSSEWKIERLAP